MIPYLGSVVGVIMYMLFVGVHIPPTDEDQDDDDDRSEDWDRKVRKSQRRTTFVNDDGKVLESFTKFEVIPRVCNIKGIH